MPKYWKNKVKTFLASNKALFNYGVKKKIDVYHPNLKKEKKKKICSKYDNVIKTMFNYKWNDFLFFLGGRFFPSQKKNPMKFFQIYKLYISFSMWYYLFFFVFFKWWHTKYYGKKNMLLFCFAPFSYELEMVLHSWKTSLGRHKSWFWHKAGMLSK